MTDDERQELQALRREVFGDPPDQIGPASGITLDHVIEFSRDWQRSTGRMDADVRTDPDGIPITVGESYTVQCAGLVISRADADRLGIVPGQYPGILIIPTPKKGHTP